MTIPVKLLLLLSVVCIATVGADKTRTANAKGDAVVIASVTLVQGSCIFENDYLFLRRLAFVATNNGEDSYPDGGIWGVSHQNFLDTQTYTAIFAQLQSDLNVDWASTTWADMKKPLYSCIAAMITIEKLGSGSVPVSVADQAAFYAAHFGGDANEYITKAPKLITGCGSRALDIAFVLDSSGSVSHADYGKSKLFTEKVVERLDVSPDAVRVAVVEFSTTVKGHIFFNDNTNLVARIRAIPKEDQGTNTAAALDYLRTAVFIAGAGSRENAPRIAIIQTDGKSNDKTATLAAAARLKAEGIIVFGIGLGSGIDVVELNTIATDPDCTHVRMLDFAQLNSIYADIEQVACNTPIVVDDNSTTDISCNTPQTIKIKVGKEVSVLTFPDSGVLKIYGSYLTPNPNQAYADFAVTAQNSQPNVLYLTASTKDLYLTITSSQTDKCNGSFLFETEHKNSLIKTGASNLCVKNQKVEACTDTDYIKSGNYVEVNKNTLPECQNGPGYYAHPISDRKYIYCTAGNVAYIVDCPRSFQYLPSAQDCVAPADPNDPCPVCTAFNWKRGIRKFPMRGDRKKYVDCSGPLTCTVEECPLRYLPKKQTCKTPKVGRCPQYPSKTYICCKGVLFPKASYGKAKCCEASPYDGLLARCCSKTVASTVGMKRPRCCAKVAYDAKNQKCKNGKVVPK